MNTADSLSYYHRGGVTPLIGGTIGDYFRRVVRDYPTNDAVVSLPQSKRLSYRELYDAVDRLARGFLAMGIRAGERVGIWSTDNLEWVLVQLATARIGAVLANINPAFLEEELGQALKEARVNVLLLTPGFRTHNYAQMLLDLVPELHNRGPVTSQRFPHLRAAVVFDADDPDNTQRPAPGYLTWQDVNALATECDTGELEKRESELDADDPINIQFTSGTTGSPKAVVLTHHNLLNNGYFVARAMNFTAQDRLCVPVPFYHCFGMVVSNIACLTHGATIVIPSPHFEAGATLRAIETERCTALHGVPTMFVAELNALREGEYDMSSLRTGIMAGAPCPPALVRRVIDELGCSEILIGYGQTEASPVTHCTHPNDPYERRIGTVGTNLPHQEVKVVDPMSGRTLPIGDTGEVCFRGYHVMRGYFQNEAATKAAIEPSGWLHSGDLGSIDDEGYLQITGRLKDMIIRGGENIYPVEIESFYHEHPLVDDIAVFGVDDPEMGEEVGAWVRLHAGAGLNAADLREHARGKIAHFKVPKYIWIVDDFPMTVTGKIQKHRIREIANREVSKSRTR